MQLVFGNWYMSKGGCFPEIMNNSISWLTQCFAEWNHELRHWNTGFLIPPRTIHESTQNIPQSILVAGFKHDFYFPSHIWDVILSIDFHIFQRAGSTTRIILFISFYVLFLLVSLFLLQMSDFLCSFCPDLVREFSVSSVAVAWKGLTANQPVFHRTLVFQPWHVAFEIPKKYLGWLLKNLGIIINRKPFSTN